MNAEVVQAQQLWPLLAYLAIVLAIVGAMLAIPQWLAPRNRHRAIAEPFESGIVPVGGTRLRFAVHFYPVAVFFVIFDLEAIFIFAWSVAFRETGWPGYLEMLVFIGILLASLLYLCKVGALDWRTARQKQQDTTLGQ